MDSVSGPQILALAWEHQQAGRLDDAAAAYRRAIDLGRQLSPPSLLAACNNLGNVLKDLRQLEAAVDCFHQAIALEPAQPEPYNNLGNVLIELGRLDEAVTACSKALQINPAYGEAYSNLGNALTLQGHLDAALAVCRRGIAAVPRFAETHWIAALALLTQGNWTDGWREYEWRWRCKVIAPDARQFSQPLWNGSDLAGKTILLYCEQGIGDAVQFIRLADAVAQRGGRVIVEAPPQLQTLLAGAPGVSEVVARGQTLPDFDVQSPLLSLPLALGLSLHTIPAHVPYLRVDRARLQRFGALAGATRSAPRVGLVWAGSPAHRRDRHRSIPPALLAPLAQLPNIAWYSLQKGPAARQAPPAGMNLIDFTDQLADFADTAALLSHLDLVISVDTAVAHLAGALAKPVWTLLPYAPDWRWMRDRHDSPWYPTMRLFRQRRAGDWDGVLRDVVVELMRDPARPGSSSH